MIKKMNEAHRQLAETMAYVQQLRDGGWHDEAERYQAAAQQEFQRCAREYSARLAMQQRNSAPAVSYVAQKQPRRLPIDKQTLLIGLAVMVFLALLLTPVPGGGPRTYSFSQWACPDAMAVNADGTPCLSVTTQAGNFTLSKEVHDQLQTSVLPQTARCQYKGGKIQSCVISP